MVVMRLSFQVTVMLLCLQERTGLVDPGPSDKHLSPCNLINHFLVVESVLLINIH